MIINLQIWVYKENMCPFISMVLFCDYKFSNMSIQGNGFLFFFFWNLKFLSWIAPKHTTLILPKQSDFRSGDSCTNQLLSISHEILSVFDDSLEVRGVFLDISKAFGRVWHEGLLVTTKEDIGRSDYFNKMFLKL